MNYPQSSALSGKVVIPLAIPSDKFSGLPRGFAFVEMGNKTEAEAAIAGLNGKSLKERTIVVNEITAAPRITGAVAAATAAAIEAEVTAAAEAAAAVMAAVTEAEDVQEPRGGRQRY